METHEFTKSDITNQLITKTEWNTRIVWVDRDDRIRILPTVRASIKHSIYKKAYPLRKIANALYTASMWLASIPKRYALF